ncbi:MAG: hypothetical protein E7298_11105 [Lachnospiraceae bacterium]|nr:hypothetical protein [Lachnospiraceae bacterium]
MILKNTGYEEIAKSIRKGNRRIVVYGAGMIGQIVVPYIIETYRLHDYVDCYVDMDKRKLGTKVIIGTREYEIKHPDLLRKTSEPVVILLTNSKFSPILDYLDGMDSLADSECYIIPVIQKMEQRISIPKVINCCWFGGKEKPEFIKECMRTWKEQCPDYEIREWNENNWDVNKYEYTRQAYEKGRYGFITDIARLDILFENGGIYMDTDVKMLKPLDELLFNKGYIGLERWGNINSGGGMGAIPHHPMIQEMLDYRFKYPFVMNDGSINIETNGLYETVPFIRHGLRIDNTMQIINGMTVYPADVFHPYDYMSREEKIADNTISIHYFYGGWMDEEDRKNRANTYDKYEAVIKRMEAAV